tara:strand:- start:75 stop:821 length:747 start_codon:yes stop_codon:yes gene_type:complete
MIIHGFGNALRVFIKNAAKFILYYKIEIYFLLLKYNISDINMNKNSPHPVHWRRDFTNKKEANPFKRTPLPQNTRWKKLSSTPKNNTTLQNSSHQNPPQTSSAQFQRLSSRDTRASSAHSKRPYSRNYRDFSTRKKRDYNRNNYFYKEKKPKKAEFAYKAIDFPSLSGDDKSSKVSAEPLQNWRQAALMGRSQPSPQHEKKQPLRNHQAQDKDYESDEDIDWSDEERLPNEINDINKYDYPEYQPFDK